MEVHLSNSLLQANQWFDLAYGSNSTLTMTMHAATNRVVNRDWNLGRLPMASGTVHMAGGSLIDVQHADRRMYVGRGGYGELTASGSRIQVRGDALIGHVEDGPGHGVLALNDLSSMTVSGAVFIAAAEGGTGAVALTGFSSLQCDILTVGTLGAGHLTLDNGMLSVREFWAGSGGDSSAALTFRSGWWIIGERAQVMSVPEWIIGSHGPTEAGAVLFLGSGTNHVFAPLTVESNGSLIIPQGSENYVGGALVNRGGLLISGPLSCEGLRVEDGGQLHLDGGTLQVSGDVEVIGPGATANLLYGRLDCVGDTGLRLSIESEDRGAQLAGFTANQAIGTLNAGTTVEVARTAYAWKLEGAGELVLAEGVTLYYVDGDAWSGTVTSAGGQLVQVPVTYSTIQPQDAEGVLLRWSAGADLHFAVDWTDSLQPGNPFLEAIRITATNEWAEWVDLGDDDRPPPTDSPHRFYRLRAWP